MHKKDTPTRHKTSTKTDPLKPYKQDAQKIIALLFDDDGTPGFVTDLLEEWLTELEGRTQVFWNRREIAAVALPLMFQAADEMGIDYMSQSASVVRDAIANVHGRNRLDEAADARLELSAESDSPQENITETDGYAVVEVAKYRPIAWMLDKLHSNDATPMIVIDMLDRLYKQLHDRYNPHGSNSGIRFWAEMLAQAKKDGLRLFKQRDEAEATAQGHTPQQHTAILMLPIYHLRAEEIAERLVQDRQDAEDLAELLCGIAAIEHSSERQETAYSAVRAAYHTTTESDAPIAAFVADIYKQREAEAEGEQ